MSETSDALLALREAIKSRAPITFSKDGAPAASLAGATHIHLSPSQAPLPRSTPTRWKKSGPGNETYTLDALYLVHQLQGASGGEYMKQAREHGMTVGMVSITERKAVLDYLEGRIETHPSIIQKDAGKGEGATAAGATTSPQKRRHYVPDAKDVQIVKRMRQNEVELEDRSTVLRGQKLNDFTNLRNTYAEKLKKLKDSSKSGAVVPTPAVGPGKFPSLPSQPKARVHGAPIILVSSSPTALITMYNVQRFLGESAFETSQEARAKAGNSRPPELIHIYRKVDVPSNDGTTAMRQATRRYAVYDNAEKIPPDGWDRVVCVLTTGQAWQFRPYKWSEPRTLFHHVKGMYVSWANDPPNTKITDWNVTEIKIDKHRRHVDKSTVAHFWRSLDSWMGMNKPALMRTQ
ncbi:RNA polymerase II-associated protein [Schizophyllum fasciatum]